MPPETQSLFDLEANDLDGSPVSLDAYRGRAVLVVNVASECGYTPQYAGLQALADEYAERGLAVLGFPSNEFGGQEPGDAATIRAFCTERYDVTFPLFEKCTTKAGPGQSPVYAFLGSATGELPSWNFGKYLVARDGTSVTFFESGVDPTQETLRSAVEAALSS